MLSNYIKIILKVLMRRKLFTIISLFGISITMTILLVGTSFYYAIVKPDYPAKKGEKIFFINHIHFYEEKGNNEYLGSIGYHFLDKYIRPLTSPEKISIVSDFYVTLNTYINNKIIELDVRHTDEVFWQILDFDFIEGRPFNKIEVDHAEPVAVMNESTANEYFGTCHDIIGKTIEVDKINYKITGIVRDVSSLNIDYYGELWVPLTTKKEELSSDEFRSIGGNFISIILSRKPSDLPEIENELQQVIRKFRSNYPDNVNFVEAHVNTRLRHYVENGLDISIVLFKLLLSLLILIFLLIPSLNLININVSRIQERYSEIGIRKSFGATKIDLVNQLLVENLIITSSGSLFAVLFSDIILNIIERSGVIPYVDLNLNIRVLITGFIICLLFSLLSGILPAYRMARLQIIHSLRGGEL
jgi:putative ABC transport system permease protein